MIKKWFKKATFVLSLLLVLFLLIGCSSGNSRADYDSSRPNEEGSLNDDYSIVVNNVNRKIIYTAKLNIKSEEITKTTKNVKALLNNEEWVEREELTDNYNYLTIRVKTDRLDAFLNNIQSEYETTSFLLESSDITNSYASITAKIDSLEREQQRLIDLYATATINEMIHINQRLSQIETQLLELNQNLNQFDSLIEYSTVYLYIYGPRANPNPPSYGKTLKTSFNNGWNAVVYLSKGFVQIIVTLIPFTIIVVPIAGIFVGIKIYKQKKDKNNKE